MENLEYLKGIKGADDIWHKGENVNYIDITKKDFYGYRKVKVLEIIAEELININETLISIRKKME